MTEKEIRKLTRADLLEMLIDQSRELQDVRQRLREAEEELSKRALAIDKAGTLAEASMQLSGIFDAAQVACAQYTENIRLLSERQEGICSRLVKECEEEIAARLQETRLKCEALEMETRDKCFRMLKKAMDEVRDREAGRI